MHFSTLVSAAAFASTALAGYVLQDDYLSKDFYSNFDFFTATDPTHGFVKYVDQNAAKSMGLLNTTAKASWGVDTKNKDAGGRASVRLTSKKSYNKGLVVIDVQHMPFGCGTWPAFWMVGPDWPKSGEIDILEGVHEQDVNAFTLHTGAGCSIGKDVNIFSSIVKTKNCDVKASGQDENAGCGVSSQDKKSYGAGLNGAGGGVFATEWTADYIQIFFFPRGSVPKDALGDAPNPSTWGKPAAKWDKTGCDITKFFKNQQIVFDTTFCGDWAGNTWSTSSCKSKAATCNAFVQNNPSSFKNAYWNINALKVYQNGGTAPKSSSTYAVASSKPATSVKPSSTIASSKPTTSAKPSPAVSSSKLSSAIPSSKLSSAVSSSKPSSVVSNSKLASSAKPTSTGAAVKPPVSAGENTKLPTSAATTKVSQVTVSSSSALTPSKASTAPAAGSSKPAASSGGMSDGFSWPTSSQKPTTKPTTTASVNPLSSSDLLSSKAASTATPATSAAGCVPVVRADGKVACAPSSSATKAQDASVAPTDASDSDEDEEPQIVYETVRKTVVVTVSPPAATHKRHASLHKRRQGQHMHHA
ncbi:hypothetical protein P280DRAFT_554148 [Massarina eburnea CBS 473.64]|uniref:endo-1,3(4)-beta-glucanase n=1 Tax=Massarina eburnea CBS 473.64 TaxID=1395130 RepID=A0A6A6RHF4_9PLEO|nr:hypothetical protein P280DRAFT_554148 [Massarina eburnea CBS 473.64]